MRSTFLTRAALAAGVSIGAMATASSALAQTPTPADELLIDNTVVIGGNGGVAVKEDKSTYLSGPITAIRVCAGDRLDSLTVTYGRREGKKIGGNGGTCKDVPIKPGEKITAVRVRHGDWIDGIQFQVDGKWSDYYGSSGGVEQTKRSDGGGALAFIEGRVGDKIDQLSFSFGLPYLIKDVKYDRQAIKDQLALAPIERIGWQCFTNSTSVEQEVNKEFSQAVTETVSWDFETTTEWGVEAAYSFGVEGLGEASFTASFGQSSSERRGKEDTKEKTLTDSIKTKVPEGAKIQTKFVASKKALNIPFTYTMAHYRNGDRNDIVQEKQFTGKFEGVTYTNDNATWEPVSNCEAGSPLEELGTPEQQAAATATPPPAQQPVATAPANQQQAALEPSPAQAPAAPVDRDPAPVSEPVNEPETIAQAPMGTPDATSVSYVETSNGGAFSLDDSGDWHELSSEGEKRFTFEVTDVTDDCIYLFDASRGVVIVLDLSRNVVQYAPDLDSEPFDLYDIAAAE